MAHSLDELAGKVVGVETRLDGLEKGMGALAGGLGEIRNLLEQRAKAPWSTIIGGISAAVTIMTVIGALARQPIDADLARHESRIERINEVLVPRVEHERDWTRNDNDIQRIRDFILKIDERLRAVEKKP